MGSSNRKSHKVKAAEEVESILAKLDDFLPSTTGNTVAEPANGFAAVSNTVSALPREAVDAGILPAGEIEAYFSQLRRFHYTAKKTIPAHLSPDFRLLLQTEPHDLIAASMYAYRDFTKLRHDYPVCIAGNAAAPRVVPLRAIFDGLIAGMELQGDEAELQKRSLLKLEQAIKAALPEREGRRLSDLWETALQQLESQNRGDSKKLQAAREVPEVDGPVYGYSAASVLHILKAAGRASRQQAAATFASRLETLHTALSDVLTADESRSPRARSAEGLSASMGKAGQDDIDFAEFSNILNESKSSLLPEDRRQRISSVLQQLQQMRSWYVPEAPTGAVSGDLPGQETCLGATAAMQAHQARMNEFTGFFRALHIAQLEIDNRYQPEVHDAFFAGFETGSLTREERQLIPPVLLHLRSGGKDAPEMAALITILSSDMNIKILQELADIWPANELFAEADKAGLLPPVLAQLALNLNGAYVMQCPSSALEVMLQGFAAGTAWSGPALFSVYTGSGTNALPGYLLSAATAECRLVPVFIKDPSAGNTLAKCLNISDTPQPERIWPVSRFTYQTGESRQESCELNFTPADYLAMDPRFQKHFLVLPPRAWHSRMLPLAGYLQLADNERPEFLPYLLMVDADGVVQRVLITHPVVSSLERIAANWRYLQELGGINNSHVATMLDAERERLEEEKRKAIAEVTERFEAEMSRTIGELTDDIIARIAAGLLSDGAATMASLPATAYSMPEKKSAPAPVPAAAEAATVEEKTPETAEEPDTLEIAEPYIDSALCTSCNDCINLNNRVFAYDGNKQAYVKDASAGTFRELVEAAEKCPVHIIHPGKPKNMDEPAIEDWIKRAAQYN